MVMGQTSAYGAVPVAAVIVRLALVNFTKNNLKGDHHGCHFRAWGLRIREVFVWRFADCFQQLVLAD